jgi:hypothetical protein
MTYMQNRHEGPWPLTGTLDCNWCGREVDRTDRWRAWWDPYGWCGWRFVCGECDEARTAVAAVHS